MYIQSLDDLQNWVDYQQKGKYVGLLTNKDVNLFWKVQKKLGEASKVRVWKHTYICNHRPHESNTVTQATKGLARICTGGPAESIAANGRMRSIKVGTIWMPMIQKKIFMVFSQLLKHQLKNCLMLLLNSGILAICSKRHCFEIHQMIMTKFQSVFRGSMSKLNNHINFIKGL